MIPAYDGAFHLVDQCLRGIVRTCMMLVQLCNTNHSCNESVPLCASNGVSSEWNQLFDCTESSFGLSECISDSEPYGIPRVLKLKFNSQSPLGFMTVNSSLKYITIHLTAWLKTWAICRAIHVTLTLHLVPTEHLVPNEFF